MESYKTIDDLIICEECKKAGCKLFQLLLWENNFADVWRSDVCIVALKMFPSKYPCTL